MTWFYGLLWKIITKRDRHLGAEPSSCLGAIGSDLERRGQPSHLAAVENIDDEDHPDPAPPGWDASEVKDCKPRVSLRDNTAYKRLKKTQKVVM